MSLRIFAIALLLSQPMLSIGAVVSDEDASLQLADCPGLVAYRQKHRVATIQADQKKAINDLAAAYYEDSLRLFPHVATEIGETRYNDRLQNDISDDFRANLAGIYKAYLAQLSLFSKPQLEENDLLTYEVLNLEWSTGLESLRFPENLMPIGKMFDIPTIMAVFAAGETMQPFKTANDYRAFIRRSNDFSVWVDTAIRNMREGIARKVTIPKVIAEKSATQFEGLISKPSKETLFWKPLLQLPATLDETEMQRLETEYRDAVERVMIPAYQRLVQFLRAEYITACRTSLGLAELPNGNAWYAQVAREYTTTDLRPEEMYALGLREVARLEAEMERLGVESGFNGLLDRLAAFLKARTPGACSTREQLRAGYDDLKERIKNQLPRMFATIPVGEFEIRLVEPFREKTSASQYQDASVDGTRPGIFFVNASAVDEGPQIPSESLYLHEAAPGHYFQSAIALEQKNLPMLRRVKLFSAFQEGWALYAESLGPELGCYTNAYQKLEALRMEMLRARRLVLDTALHTKGWSREKALAYLMKSPGQTETEARLEIDRYIAWPGQALSYKIGELKIKSMRAKAQRELGDRFDIREFHDELINSGALPLRILEAKIDRWTARKKSRDLP